LEAAQVTKLELLRSSQNWSQTRIYAGFELFWRTVNGGF
jgi:hypothetical protein